MLMKHNSTYTHRILSVTRSYHHSELFNCQTFDVFESVLRERFLGIDSIHFNNGSILVNSVIRLSDSFRDDERQRLGSDMNSTFVSNGFTIEDFSLEPTKGSASCLRSVAS